MSNILLSIIIPVYNVEQYLRQCLDSVYSQNLEACEVICVNDGSTDSSRKILQEFKDNYNDLILIDRENAGLIVARNTGYKIARGEYIFYLDSDDYLLANVINNMLEFVTTNKLDVALFNADKDDGSKYYVSKSKLDYVDTGITYFKDFFTNNNFFPPSVQWLYLYRKEFLDTNRIYFPEDNLQEDEPFTIKAFLHAIRVSTLDIPIVYHRVLRQGSITQQAHLPHLIDARIAWHRIFEYLKNQKCTENIFYHKIFSLYMNTISKLTSNSLIKYRKGFFNNKDFRVMRKCAINSDSYKYYWYYRHNYRMFRWYISSDKRCLILKKIINRLLSMYFQISTMVNYE